MDQISVIIPCRNEEKYIELCLNSVVNNDYPREYMEVIIIDGESTDKTRDIIKSYTNRFPFIRLLSNKELTVPYALNKGIKEAKGDYIIRLDAHSEIPSNYFSELITWSRKLGADCIGTICITEVRHKNAKTLSIQKVLTNKFGVGNSYFRIGTDEIKEVDTVPFGCFRREIFDKVGLFDVRLTRNQDIELNKRIKRNGGKVFLLPHVYSKYFARETYHGIARNNYQTGLFNILTIYFTKKVSALSLRHLVPLMFVLSMLLPLIAMIWFPYAGLLSCIIFAIYLITIFFISLKINDGKSSTYNIVLAFAILHFSYGLGSLSGLLRIDALLKNE